MAYNMTVDALTNFVKALIRKDRSSWGSFVQGTFVSAEVSDPALSFVTVLGTDCRYVRRAKSVGTMTAGQQLLLVKGGGIPMTIIAILEGNITRTSE